MSAAYDTARATLDAARADLDVAAEGADPIPFAAAVAQIGTGESILALAEEVEALVELLRERLPVPAETVVHYRAATTEDVPGDPRCVRCLDRRSVHDDAVAGHPFAKRAGVGSA